MHKMPHNDFSDRKGVPEGQNDDQLGPSHQGQPRATILAIYGRAVGDRAKLNLLGFSKTAFFGMGWQSPHFENGDFPSNFLQRWCSPNLVLNKPKGNLTA
jgi:hypothetical protein